MDEKEIYKYLTGQATAEEEKELLSWLEASSENKKLFFDVEAIWRAKHQFTDKNQPLELYNSLVRMNEHIDQAEAKQNNIKHKNQRKLLYWWAGVAASILVTVLILTNIIDKKSNVIYSYANFLPDSVKQVKLKDGSTVWLNTNAMITFSEKYMDKERRVKLKGLAFFEVEKDSLRPFVVETEAFSVKVLGTAFSVNSDYSKNKSEAVLLRGSIQLEDKAGESLAVLHPGQQALYSNTLKTLEINEIDANSYSLWRFHLISLPNASIADIINSLEHTYGVKILVDSEDIKQHKYNFYYKEHDDLNNVLEQLFYLTGQRAKIAH